MTKKELAQALSGRTDLSASAAEDVLNAAFDIIGEQLKKGEDVKLAGFGNFETRERAARTGRNPQTGEEIQIAASTSVGFKAAAQLKRAVNG
ncbi:HU family DNA-binding protein [Phycicoccus sp. CSK15P-2]|uniref:HU family DNA-binding protein n=1 Tax=Phycicoccus sp. CSK15P-2 TaxID=2807627 RepID=UPI00194EE2F7|nr:HU family DNA-binding protein [Phycicoccus sp. CSK15P-2]MBM6405334.1 HU family DNA-binding protein [Phycicoccus sp. CSK15P-2]